MPPMPNLLPLTEHAPNRASHRRRCRRLPMLLADAKRLAPMLSIGLRTLRSMDAAGKLPSPLRIGGKVLWDLREVRLWIRLRCPNRESWEAIRKARNKYESPVG